MIVEELLQLPAWVSFEGIEFTLQLFSNGSHMRLAYGIGGVSDDSPHKRDIDDFGSWSNIVVDSQDPPFQGFLMLYENIETDVDLIWAARSMWFWLIEHGFSEQLPKKKTDI